VHSRPEAKAEEVRQKLLARHKGYLIEFGDAVMAVKNAKAGAATGGAFTGGRMSVAQAKKGGAADQDRSELSDGTNTRPRTKPSTTSALRPKAAVFKFDHVLADHGISGVSTRLADRPQGRRLFDMLRAGDTLVVRFLRRLGLRLRNGGHKADQRSPSRRTGAAAPWLHCVDRVSLPILPENLSPAQPAGFFLRGLVPAAADDQPRIAANPSR
jgi:hypothetical protein